MKQALASETPTVQPSTGTAETIAALHAGKPTAPEDEGHVSAAPVSTAERLQHGAHDSHVASFTTVPSFRDPCREV